jgi:NAD(P)H dehydrogenase (quinone)
MEAVVTKILVTGATGKLGGKTLERLLQRRPASELVGLARDPGRAQELASAGVEIRAGDYSDYGSLLEAFKDIQTVLLVSTHAFTDRIGQHSNVIAAAREAGVEHLVYTPIIRKDSSAYIQPEVTDADIATEQTLKSSGLAYTLVGHPPFLESFWGYIGGEAAPSGVRVPAGLGKVAPATRDDLAEAQAVVLSDADHHRSKTYALHGDPAVSFADVAEILSRIGGQPVPYVPVAADEYVAGLVARGMAQPSIEFLMGWMRGINEGEWDEPSGDLERLTGNKPMSTAEFLRRSYVSSI